LPSRDRERRGERERESRGGRRGGERTPLNPWVEPKIEPPFNPCAEDTLRSRGDHRGMTTSEYIVNAAFLLVVLRQARERRLDLRFFVLPLGVLFFVARQYVDSLPTAGNDLLFIAMFASVGLALGAVCGLATHVRLASDGVALARVGRLAGILLAAGIASRMLFAFALGHGAAPAIRSFSLAHPIGAAAWPIALAAMAVTEVVARLVVVQIRGRRLARPSRVAPTAAA
jgi:hypothetical protein